MGGACSMYEESEVHTGFWLGNLRERDHLEVFAIDGRITLKWIFNNLHGRMNWIDVGEVRDSWRAVVNAVMNVRIL
jgi:hypothetical protein